MAAAASAVASVFPLHSPPNPKFVLKTTPFCAGLQKKPASRRTFSSSPCKSLSLVPTWSNGPDAKFLFSNGEIRRSRRQIRVNSISEAGSTGTAVGFPNILGVLHLVVSLGLILVSDKLLKRTFSAASIKFPSALFGMFCVFSVLMILDSIIPSAAKSLEDFFEPANLFIQRWLPLFYVPSMVILPIAVRDIPTASGLKIFFILVGGWMASLCVAGFTALSVRKMVKTEMVAAVPMAKPSPFSTTEIGSWTAVFTSSFVLALISPTAFGTTALTRLPFLLAATVLGYMVGSG